jgi:hypothetical protein
VEPHPEIRESKKSPFSMTLTELNEEPLFTILKRNMREYFRV